MNRKKPRSPAVETRRSMRHPLFGDVPLVRHESTAGGKTYEYWRPDPAYRPRLPRGAVEGDVTKQVHCACHTPKYFYVDENRSCVQCGERFTFSGAEQKYWYEVRKFNFHSVPVRCPACRRLRRSEHVLREQIAEARRAVAAGPDHPEGYLALARAIVAYDDRTGEGRLEDAIAAARRARKLSPGAVDAAALEARARAQLATRSRDAGGRRASRVRG